MATAVVAWASRSRLGEPSFAWACFGSATETADGSATEPPDPYLLDNCQEGKGRMERVSGLPWAASPGAPGDLPTATVGQPFRLSQRTAPKPPEVSRTPRAFASGSQRWVIGRGVIRYEPAVHLMWCGTLRPADSLGDTFGGAARRFG